MFLRSATLIQNIANFRIVIEPVIFQAMQELGITNVAVVTAIKWIISEQLELCAGLFDRQHIHNEPDCLQIHNWVDNWLYDNRNRTLSKTFCQWIAAPYVYGDENQIDVVLVGDDLYFYYSTDRIENNLYRFRTPTSF